MARASITKRIVDAAKAAARDQFIWDDQVSGFGLKVTPAGGKVYVYQYRIARPGEAAKTPTKRYTIGKHGNLTPEQARKRAKELAVLVEKGVDPRQLEAEAWAARDEAERVAREQQRINSELAFEKVAAVWLDHYENEADRRPSSVRMARMVVKNYLSPKLAGKPLPYIGRGELQPIIDAIPASKRALRRSVFAYASILFGWAVRRGTISLNPLTVMSKPAAPKARERALSDDELALVWNATNALGYPFGPFVRLLMLSGQRRTEVAEMRWNELDRQERLWTLPTERAKNGRAHIVPISDAMMVELDWLAARLGNKDKVSAEEWPSEGLVFSTTGKTAVSGISKAKRVLDALVQKASGERLISAWRLHDLRRTAATGFQRLGVRFEVTEAILNHISGARAGVAGIYQKYDWREEKRIALQAWGKHIEELIRPNESSNVVAIAPASKRA
jgi:integrase